MAAVAQPETGSTAMAKTSSHSKRMSAAAAEFTPSFAILPPTLPSSRSGLPKPTSPVLDAHAPVFTPHFVPPQSHAPPPPMPMPMHSAPPPTMPQPGFYPPIEYIPAIPPVPFFDPSTDSPFANGMLEKSHRPPPANLNIGAHPFHPSHPPPPHPPRPSKRNAKRPPSGTSTPNTTSSSSQPATPPSISPRSEAFPALGEPAAASHPSTATQRVDVRSYAKVASKPVPPKPVTSPSKLPVSRKQKSTKPVAPSKPVKATSPPAVVEEAKSRGEGGPEGSEKSAEVPKEGISKEDDKSVVEQASEVANEVIERVEATFSSNEKDDAESGVTELPSIVDKAVEAVQSVVTTTEEVPVQDSPTLSNESAPTPEEPATPVEAESSVVETVEERVQEAIEVVTNGAEVVKDGAERAVDAAKDVGDSAREKAEDVIDAVQKSDIVEAAEEMASDVGEAVQEKASDVSEAVEAKVVEAKEAIDASEVVTSIKETIEEVKVDATPTADQLVETVEPAVEEPTSVAAPADLPSADQPTEISPSTEPVVEAPNTAVERSAGEDALEAAPSTDSVVDSAKEVGADVVDKVSSLASEAAAQVETVVGVVSSRIDEARDGSSVEESPVTEQEAEAPVDAVTTLEVAEEVGKDAQERAFEAPLVEERGTSIDEPVEVQQDPERALELGEASPLDVEEPSERYASLPGDLSAPTPASKPVDTSAPTDAAPTGHSAAPSGTSEATLQPDSVILDASSTAPADSEPIAATRNWVDQVGNQEEDDESDSDDDREDPRAPRNAEEPPSLTLSIFNAPGRPWKEVMLAVLGSLGINVLLPFVNGVMLGAFTPLPRSDSL